MNIKMADTLLMVDIKGKSLKFPLVWLRDNCQCEKCFHPVTMSRIIDWKIFQVNIKPKAVLWKVDKLEIMWSDEHISNYTIDWLYERSFQKEDREQYAKTVYKFPKIEWNEADFKSVCKTFDFNDVLNNDNHLKNWLETLCTYGVALIYNAESDPQACRKLSNRIDFIKKTHYGEEFIIKAKPGTTSAAYLPINAQMHTDSPYYEYQPGVLFLHCIVQTKGNGGGNLLCDGLYAAKQLKKYNIDFYNTLKQTEVYWEDIGEESGNKFRSIHKSPVICENSSGEIIKISLSVCQRSSHMNVDAEKVHLFYEALRCFVDFIYKHAASYKLLEGEILCIDNIRLLHGREKYQDTPDNIRHLIGTYVDWEYINSRLRVLQTN